jgi:hypothetical protein
MTSILNYWLSDNQERLKMVASNSKELGHPDSALQIAEILWEASEKPVLY